LESVPKVSGRPWGFGKPSEKKILFLSSQRGVEQAIVILLAEAHPNGLTQSAVRRELTAAEDSPARAATINRAVQGLVEAKLVIDVSGVLLLTPPAIRASELGVFEV
jgi:hypothetical protein